MDVTYWYIFSAVEYRGLSVAEGVWGNHTQDSPLPRYNVTYNFHSLLYNIIVCINNNNIITENLMFHVLNVSQTNQTFQLLGSTLMVSFQPVYRYVKEYKDNVPLFTGI